MISARWLGKRKPYWDRIEAIIKKAGNRGVRALAHSELQELGLLYRQIAADLASVREDPLSQPWAAYLNQLLARAHNLIYMGTPRSTRAESWNFIESDFPRIFRETWSYTAVAFMLFLAGRWGAFRLPRRSFLSTILSRSGDEQHDRPPRNVDPFGAHHQAPGFQFHHDQQPDRLIHHVRSGNIWAASGPSTC